MPDIFPCMPIAQFVRELKNAYERKDGYIMGATGQNPKKWAADSWWFSQYTSTKQHDQALYWRANAERVWDCNGLAEGLYKDFSRKDINTKARYNYAQWCDPKGSGLIPESYRVPGAAVFWSDTNSAKDIHHVAYLVEPVTKGKPGSDWYIIEAAGVMSGVVKTRLFKRNPNYWGRMTKYFDYGMDVHQQDYHLGDRVLRAGMEGTDVKELQEDLIRLAYSCGSWGADGEFGDATEIAVRKFQKDKKLEVDGVVGPLTVSAIEAALTKADKPTTNGRIVQIVGGNCYVRSAPKVGGDILGIAKNNEVYPYQGETTEDGWNLIIFANQNGWVSGKYSKVKK
jgi:hypothetical protein